MNKDIINKPIWEEVYKICSQIPKGFISNYKEISNKLNISPRVVGQALKNNPYDSNLVPCHRVISSTYFIGGFRGQWGKGEKVSEKISKLSKEGIIFNEKGFVAKETRDKVLFNKFI